jgi:hypothetical protein
MKQGEDHQRDAEEDGEGVEQAAEEELGHGVQPQFGIGILELGI